VIAEVYDPDTAVAAGFLDRVVSAAELASTHATSPGSCGRWT